MKAVIHIKTILGCISEESIYKLIGVHTVSVEEMPLGLVGPVHNPNMTVCNVNVLLREVNDITCRTVFRA